MDKLRRPSSSDQTQAARSDPLRGAVRRALQLSTAVLAAGLALGVMPSASAAPFPPEFELSSLLPDNGGDGSAGFVATGDSPGDYSGESMKAAGDINADGIDDLIIGAWAADPSGRSNAGESYVVFGRDTAQTGDPRPITLLGTLRLGDGSPGFVLDGIDPNDQSGSSVSAAGDINGDGIDDVIIGANLADPDGRSSAGESYVVFGRDTAQTGNFPPAFELSSLLPANGGNGSAGFVLNGIDNGDRSGDSVSAAGDINGDGIGDLIISAGSADPGGRSSAGESYVVFGRDTAQTGNFPAVFELSGLLPANGGNGSDGFVLNGIDAQDGAGFSVSAAGDVDGDGIDDVIIGANLADPGGRSSAGESYVVLGRDTAQVGNFPAEFELSSLLPANGGNGSAGFVLNGNHADDSSGRAVSAAGDVNGDSLDDLLIGAPGAGPGGSDPPGESYVVFGRDTAQSGNFPAELELSSLLPANGGNGSDGFVLDGIDPSDASGSSVSAAGDVSGDGLDDLIVGAPGVDDSDNSESYVVFGRDTAQTGNFPAVFELASLLPANGGNGSAGFVLNGIDIGDRSGDSVTAADINADGIDDVIIAATQADPLGRDRAGESYIVWGRKDTDNDNIADPFDNCTLIANPDQRDTNGDGYGNVCDPDLDNDGIVNFLDLGMMKELFFTADPDADLNGDGSVNFLDLGTTKAFFFLPPGPSGLVEAARGGQGEAQGVHPQPRTMPSAPR